jgi:hypothetical protein
VLGQVLDAHRLEGAGAHVQGHVGDVHALRGQLVEQRLVEVQAGGRRGDGARLLRVDGLVTLLVELVGVVLDVGRQRQAAVGLDQLEHVAFEVQGEEFAGALARGDVEGVGQADAVARLGRLGRAHLGQHGAVVEHALDQHLDLAAGFLLAEEARLQHAGIVHHQQVAGLELVDDVGEMAVGDAVTVELQQARGAAVRQRHLGDALGRQVEIEIGKGVHSAHLGKQCREPYNMGSSVCGEPSILHRFMPATILQTRAKPPPCQPPQSRQVQKSIESKLAKLGLRTDMDLVLHLPMRYEDETQIVPSARPACAAATCRRSKASSPRTKSRTNRGASCW